MQRRPLKLMIAILAPLAIALLPAALFAGLLDHFDPSKAGRYAPPRPRREETRKPRAATVKAPRQRAAGRAWPPRPARPSADNPASWGILRLADRPLWELKPSESTGELVVPYAEHPPLLDGRLGTDWEDSAEATVTVRPGDSLALRAKHDNGVLYVAIALHGFRQLTSGATARLCFEVPASQSPVLSDSHHSYELKWEADADEAAASRASGATGAWVQRPVNLARTMPPARFAGAVSTDEDAASVPTFEFAIPLSELGVTPDGEQLGFCAIVDFPASRQRVPVGREVGAYLSQWPPGFTGLDRFRKPVFPSHPDLWGDLMLQPNTVGDTRIAAPEVEAAPVIDGSMDPGEWGGADVRTTRSAAGVHQSLHTQRAGGNLYIALVCEIPSGARSDLTVDLFLDPQGDEGLLPRPDDRCLRFTQSRGASTFEAFSWNERRKMWNVPADVTFDAAASSGVAGRTLERVIEFAVPLDELGIDSDIARTDPMGLALSVTIKTFATGPQRGR